MPPELPPLPPEARAIAEQIVGHQLLGASRTVRLINDLLVAAAAGEESDTSATALADRVRAVAAYFVAVRGETTPVVANAMAWMLDGLDEAAAGSPVALRAWVDARRQAFNDRSSANVAAIAEMGATLLDAAEALLVYDYSSSVQAVLRRLAERGHRPRLLVPESRSIDGGRPIAREALGWGYRVEMFVDAAVGSFVPGAGAALVGVETLLSDGSFLTTPGTYTLALLCRAHGVPLYVPTELIKLDRRSYEGRVRPIGVGDDATLLDSTGELRALGEIAFPAPKLDRTPARYVTAYVTELGVMPPGAIWAAGRAP